MRINRQHELNLVNYIKMHKGYESEKAIQYGVQYVVSGVVLDIHYSEKHKTTFSLTIKNHAADPEFAQLIQNFAEGIAEPANSGIWG